jgi:DMSO reductase anchor subunit
MHPASSVIIFTVASGLGFGLLTWLGLGLPNANGWAAFWYYALGFALAGGGLLASTFHLGNPQRFLKAFSQWRSSWLSREGCLSVFAMAILGIFAFGAIFLGANWQPLGYIGSVLAVLTIIATSMIYAQLKTVPRWNHWTTPLLFLLLSLGGGALLALQTSLGLILLTFAGAVQLLAWYLGDGRFQRRGTNIGTATGLGDRGKVRAFEPPHTGNNYLLKEMVHQVGRKHAVKLRVIAFIMMILMPIGLLMISYAVPLVVLALLVHMIGTFVQRWLFFAEAEHVVGLYYGKR